MHFIASLALAITLQQALPSDSAVLDLLRSRVTALPDTGKHGEGMVVGLLDRGRRLVAVGVGADDVFEIGSITKVFTASILADMMSRGEVRLDDPVARYLPTSAHIPSRNGRQITLFDLATQSSGLPRMPSNFTPRDSMNPYADYSVQQMYAFLAGYQLTHAERHATDNPNLKIGLAWHVSSRPAGKIVWHNGGTGGYRSFIGFDPARHIGVVVLCNNGNENVDDIGFHLLDETFPLTPPPPPQKHTEVAVDSLVLQRYVGDYELEPTFHIVLTREAAHLFAQATAQPRFPIFAESDSTFFLKVVDAQLTFRPDGLVLHQNGQHIPGRKVH